VVRPPVGVEIGEQAGMALLRSGPPPDDRMRQLLHMGDRLTATAGQLTAAPEVLADAARGLPARAALVWVAEGGALLLNTVSHADPARERALRGVLQDGELPAVLHRLVDSGRPLRLPRLTGAVLRTLPEPLARFLVEDDTTSVLLAPLWGRETPIGVVAALRSCAATPFVLADQHFLQVAGRRAGMTLETAVLLDEVRQQAGVLDAVSDAVIAVDATGAVTTWNRAAERIYGVPAEAAVGHALHHSIVQSHYDVGITEEGTREILGRTGSWRGRVRQVSSSGRQVEVEVRVSARRDARGEPQGLVAVNRDLTEVLAARSAVVAQERFTKGLMDAMDNRAAVVDATGRVLSSNSRWTAGLTERDRCVCGPVAEGGDWLGGLRASPLLDVQAFVAEIEEVLAGSRPLARLECRCLDAGPERATAIEVARMDGLSSGAVVVQTDVTWRRLLQDELSHRATHDELTGLPNRSALMERLEAGLQRLDGQHLLAVLFIDLDGFKDINDGLGHAVGDQVLVAVARRLRQRCRSADTVARFGGDEFVVVSPVPDVARARATGERLVEALSEPITVGEVEVAPGASIGVTVVETAPPGPDPVGALLRDADTAMYHAKERGRGRLEFFDTSLRVNAENRLEYASALRRAVPNAELRLRFQTRRTCGDRHVAGVEALLRWRHPVLGDVPPSTFIPVAERTGRIIEVGTWVLQQAMAEMVDLADDRLSVAVNVSTRQLQSPRMVHVVDKALETSGLNPSRLTLEITESALMEDPDLARSTLSDLRGLGLTIALDDFGTGWSSMSYLRTLPVDVLKIDRAFVKDLPTDPDACAVVSAVLNLGHGMGLVVVAEGVEEPEQLEILRDMGCDEYQGFIDGTPGLLDEVLAVQR